MAKGKAKTTGQTTGQTTGKTTAKAAKAQAKPSAANNKLMGLSLKTWIEGARRAKAADARGGKRGFVFAIATGTETRVLKKLLGAHLNRWQMASALESESESLCFQGANGPVWLIRPAKTPATAAVKLEKNSFARVRDLTGALLGQALPYKLEKLLIEFTGLTLEEECAALLGLELAAYSYQENRPQAAKARKKLPELMYKSTTEALTSREIRATANLALATNIARHYVNIPGGELTPRTYADSITELFADSDSVKVEVWKEQKLVDEKMGLLCAVGGGAADGPRFVHMKYRPKGTTAQPVALVGKGVTFDSGGLDLKPSSAMRLMKKDMGGSAAVVALMKWAEATELPLPLDGYVSLAENAVGAGSFRPGDILVARNGSTVEISNTDAEGRLVLADALDVAVTKTGADKPRAVINVATLTGAIKVALGAEVAGLFANDDHLAEVLAEAGLKRGDFMWRMPLVQAYRSQLKSTFADCSNCSDGGFGGAITAALFLESFVKDVPWAHLDVYSWKDSAGGAWAEAGGSGQPVLALSEALVRLATESRSQQDGAELA